MFGVTDLGKIIFKLREAVDKRREEATCSHRTHTDLGSSVEILCKREHTTAQRDTVYHRSSRARRPYGTVALEDVGRE